MSAWPTIPFRQTGTWLSGGTPTRNEPTFWGGDVPWIGTKDLKGFDLRTSSEFVTQLGADTGSRVVDPGAVLFVTRGMSLAKEFRVGVAATRLAFNQDVKAIVPRPELDGRFLAWFLRSKEQYVLDQCDTATHGTKRLPLERVETMPVPLPPLSEQRRIAAILDEADALRRKRREALGLLDALLRSAFLEMFGDPVTNPRGWPRRKLREAIADIEPGWSASSTDRPAAPGEWGVLKVSAVSTGRFLPDENKMVASPQFAKPPIVPRRGDLLFSRANTRELVAATCLVDTDVEGIFLPDKLWRISCFAEVAVVEWLRFLLANEAFRRTLTKQATGTSGSMLNVSQDKLLDLTAPVPPVVAQRRFASLVWAAIDERRRVGRSVGVVEDLFDALLQRAFAGSL
jgi:type I restriction enzyme S subunit